MTPSDSFLQHWYFHLPNLLMAAMIYTLIGRYVLELVFDAISKNKDAVILRVFRSVTDPLLKLIRLVTPMIVPNGLLAVFGIAWLMAARMLWFLTCVAAGMKPSVGG